MLHVLCCLAFVKCVLAGNEEYIRTRDEYLRESSVVPQIIPYIPRGDIEVRYGTQRIYMGEVIPMYQATKKLTVKFDAAPSELSTLIQVYESTCISFRWVKANIPGGDMDKVEDIIYDAPGGPWNPIAVLLVLLVFLQQGRLAANRLRDYLRQVQCGSVVEFAKKFHLDDAVGINAITIGEELCGRDPGYFAHNPIPEVMHELPDTVLEVEFFDGVTFGPGGCVAAFLTGRAPVRITFSGTRGFYYTLILIFDVLLRTDAPYSWLRINIPDNDFCRGDEVIAYDALVADYGAGGIFLLFSQGQRLISVAQASRLRTVDPRKMFDELQLGEPVAWNVYSAEPLPGVPPEASQGCYHPWITQVTHRETATRSKVTTGATVASTAQMPITETTAASPATRGQTATQCPTNATRTVVLASSQRRPITNATRGTLVSTRTPVAIAITPTTVVQSTQSNGNPGVRSVRVYIVLTGLSMLLEALILTALRHEVTQQVP